LPRIAVGDDEDVAVKVRRRLRGASCAGREAKQRDIVPSRAYGGEVYRLVEGDAVELGVVVGGAVETDDAFEKAASLGAGDQFIKDARVSKGQFDLGLVDDLRQFSGPQHRHCVDAASQQAIIAGLFAERISTRATGFTP
jgi:hypothetical protein